MQVHYGYDFSGGAVCDVKEPELVKKLLGTRHFTQAETPCDASVFHDENLPMRRRKRVINGNHNQG